MKFIFLIFFIASAFFYRLIFKNRLSYIRVPDFIISDRKKHTIFLTQVIGSIILGVFSVKILKNHFTLVSNESGNFLLLLLISYIVILIASGFCIDIVIRLSHPGIQMLNTVHKNPELFEELKELKTGELMNEQEFWNLLNRKDKPVSPEEYQQRLQELQKDLSNCHPVKLVLFYNRLHALRTGLISEDFNKIYAHIWGIKYEENHFDQFIEFIIAQGKTEYEKINTDLNEIAKLEMNILKLSRQSISSILNPLYLSKIGKFFPYGEEWEYTRTAADHLTGVPEIQVKYPEVYQKFI